MCTLILAWRVFDGTPIAAAANRDEALSRPSRPPGILDRDPTVVAPRDEEAGGTWIGYNDAGLFVAVTNRRMDDEVLRNSDRTTGDPPRFVGERSRGLLVRDALARPSAGDAVAFVRNELAAREYAGFNLVVADSEQATLLEWDGVLRTTHFDPGIHVVVNEGYDDAAPKAARIREAVRPEVDLEPDAESGADAPPGASMDVSEWFERVKPVLADRDIGACVHGDGYGTRSSSLVAVGADGEGRYWFADGKPCRTDYEAVEVDAEDGQI